MIDLEEAQSRLRKLAAERPDYVYEQPPGGCVYFGPDNTPSCIIGHALEDELRTVGVRWLDHRNEYGIHTLVGLLDLAPAAIRYLSDVQVLQDDGVPWGLAVEKADAELQFQL